MSSASPATLARARSTATTCLPGEKQRTATPLIAIHPSVGNEMEDIGIPALPSSPSFPFCLLANVQPGKMQINRPEGRIARGSYSALLKFEMLRGRGLGPCNKAEPLHLNSRGREKIGSATDDTLSRKKKNPLAS